MSTRTLFLAWQDKKPSKAWFPVGRLDADVERSLYRFRYIGGAKRAQEEVGLSPLIDFPDLDKDYQSCGTVSAIPKPGYESGKAGLYRLPSQP